MIQKQSAFWPVSACNYGNYGNCGNYGNYDKYGNYGNYGHYGNYGNYGNYGHYGNYNDYSDNCNYSTMVTIVTRSNNQIHQNNIISDKWYCGSQEIFNLMPKWTLFTQYTASTYLTLRSSFGHLWRIPRVMWTS